jgi:hypothetical protein
LIQSQNLLTESSKLLSQLKSDFKKLELQRNIAIGVAITTTLVAVIQTVRLQLKQN